MKKLLVLLTFALLIFFLCALAEETEKRETFNSGDYEYALLPDGTAEITKYMGKAKSHAIPSELDGYKVTSVGEDAFVFCDNITAITIPDSVTSIGNKAFSLCTNLTAVIIPSSVTTIGHAAFYGCWNLTAITIPDSVTSIGHWAFSGCKSLTAITIPDSVMSIGVNPFAFCDKLKTISVSADNPYLAMVDGVLFSKADMRIISYPCALDVSEYSIPPGIQIIGIEAFSFCENLTAITIPDSVTAIDEGAFFGSVNLTSVTIPDSVTSISYSAFEGCADSLTFTVGRDSYAMQYCRENGYEYTFPD